MRIGILTQPLHSNYGGFLQNYALQQVLIDLGHQPVTIDQNKDVSLFRYILSSFKSLVLLCLGRRRSFINNTLVKRSATFDAFVRNNIFITSPISKLHDGIIKRNRLEAIVVGSDQVWRPRYNKRRLPDMYLAFAKEQKIRRVAYAASFGVGNWEYTKRQEYICSKLAQSFDAISVREDSGVKLCSKYLKVSALKVMDPTLLLSKDKYEYLCTNIKSENRPFIFAYILDFTPEKQSIIDKLVTSTGLNSRIYSADAKALLSPEQWISMFRDASFVITDSFHGTCFSIIFEKNFYSIGNLKRGSTRFSSLLEAFNLQSRYIELPLTKELPSNTEIDWTDVRKYKSKQTSASIEFLKANLR